ncbi:MAG: glycogen synthase [Chloroflexota bacterium]
MKTLFLTNEYPPYVYGGAGVHVEFLSRELAKSIDVEVRSFGDQVVDEGRLRIRGYGLDDGQFTAPANLRPVFGAFSRNVAMAATNVDANVVHCHTWYSLLGGIIVKQAYGIPLVVTTHSLEPLRPWKREQLGGGYDASAWVERTAIEMADAVVAVSQGTREDVIQLFDVQPERVHVIHNGIDLDLYRPASSQVALTRHGIDPSKPYVLFVGRITRQKGIVHLARAIPEIDPSVQVVLCAGAPDTPEIAAEMEAAVAAARAARPGVFWIQEMVPRQEAIELYSHAALFCCPSVYEPFGIINLEAMACGTPVVATATGGILEVVVDGETGLLVPLQTAGGGSFEPADPARFSHDLAAAVNRLMADEPLRRSMAAAGRRRVEELFSWGAIARKTVDLYESLIDAR